MRATAWFLAAMACTLAQGARPAGAQPAAPEVAPIRLVIGLPAGGGVDQVARLLADGLSQQLGRPVLAENRTGARGNVAAEELSRAEPTAACSARSPRARWCSTATCRARWAMTHRQT
jgi:tripartite-type tricarboxylate transporter receptor subunit TctC